MLCEFCVNFYIVCFVCTLSMREELLLTVFAIELTQKTNCIF